MIALLAVLGGAVFLACLALWNLLRVTREAERARADAEYQAAERQRSERMANEMLKERSREDVARDLDTGEF